MFEDKIIHNCISSKCNVIDFYGEANTEKAEVSINDVGVKTNVDGSFVVKGLKIDYELEEEYLLKVKKEGYVSQDIKFKAKFIKGGDLPVKKVYLRHVDLEAPKLMKPGKMVTMWRSAHSKPTTWPPFFNYSTICPLKALLYSGPN